MCHLVSYWSVCRTQLVWIQERRPDIPPYTMLDTVTDTFKCLSPTPVWHKDDAHLQDKVRACPQKHVAVKSCAIT